MDCWLVVLGFNATFTAKVIHGAHVYPGFLTPVLTPLSSKATNYFSHFLCRGGRQKYPGKEVHLNRVSNSQPSGHESDMLTTEPPGRGHGLQQVF